MLHSEALMSTLIFKIHQGQLICGLINAAAPQQLCFFPERVFRLQTATGSYQLSHSVLLLHFLLQLFETLLHALVERAQVVRHPLPVERDPPTE